MNERLEELIGRLEREHSLSLDEYQYLIENRCEETAALLAEKAVRVRQAIYGRDVYVRGLIEFSNICKNDSCKG